MTVFPEIQWRQQFLTGDFFYFLVQIDNEGTAEFLTLRMMNNAANDFIQTVADFRIKGRFQ